MTTLASATVSQTPWGTTSGNASQGPTDVDRYRLETDRIAIEVLTFGAHLVRVDVPDQAGVPDNVVLTLPDLEAYEDADRNVSMGAVVGRVANRIAAGSFEIDGQTYNLDCNLAPNHIHGGSTGFGRLVWTVVDASADGDTARLELQLISPDGHEGYPGEVTVNVTYTVEPGRLTMHYQATTTAPTPIGLTNHAYWNLAGASSGATVEGHVLQLDADAFLPVDGTAIPTGEIADVDNTPMDLRAPTPLSLPIEGMSGFDHCFVVPGDLAHPCVSLSEASTGRSMLVSTDQVGVQVYTGNFLGGEFTPFGAVCLETQRFPDSPNQPSFPSVILRPGETYSSTTVHEFN